MSDQVKKDSSVLPAAMKAEPEESAQAAVLIFRAGSALFGVTATSADEVLDWAEPTPLPRLPPHIPGVIFQRGQAVALLDLVEFLQIDPAGEGTEEDDVELSRRVVVVSEGGMRVGLVCHQVRGVVELGASELEEPGALGGRAQELATHQIDLPIGLVALLDLGALLSAAKPGGGEKSS